VRKRRTARVLLFDAVGEVLLIRFVVLREEGEFVFWAAPGGEIEAGETEGEAAAREVREELGLEVEMRGPVYVDENRFVHQGEMRENTDYFFRAECGRDEPVLKGVTEDEMAIMKEIRWWSVGEIEASGERIFPENLAVRMRELGGEAGEKQVQKRNTGVSPLRNGQ
jgi:8-oxo-dGTP diphosphatase